MERDLGGSPAGRVSIHAPGRGATLIAQRLALLVRVSIHAPGRGATLGHQALPFASRGFNSRTREGCDSLDGGLKDYVTGFQFTHPGGVRRVAREVLDDVALVSIHAPGRGATVWCKVAYYGADKQA